MVYNTLYKFVNMQRDGRCQKPSLAVQCQHGFKTTFHFTGSTAALVLL